MYEYKYKPTPKNVILDVLGVNRKHELTTSQLNFISEVFGLSINSLRVTINRLVNEELMTHDDRGVYRLAPKTLAKREFINRWRSKQTKNSWDKSWVACYLLKGKDRSVRKKTLNALDWYGFKQGLDQIWIRPNNLKLTIEVLTQSLQSLGIEDDASIFVMSHIEDNLRKHWETELWPVTELDKEYAALRLQIDESTDAMESYSVEGSLNATCMLGGEAIHLLAIDPQLPAEMRPSNQFEALKKTMISYDKLGRKIWLNQLSKIGVETEQEE